MNDFSDTTCAPGVRGGALRILMLLAVVVLLAAGCDSGIAEPEEPRASLADEEARHWSPLALDALPQEALSVEPPLERQVDPIRELQDGLTGEERDRLRALDRTPTGIWTHVLADLLDRYYLTLPGNRIVTPVRSARMGALLHAGIHDALLAVWQLRYEHGRGGPAEASPDIRQLVGTGGPSWPSAHAAASEVAVQLLSELFPHEDPALFHEVREEVEWSRLAGGAEFQEDVAAGRSIGAVVAQRVVEWARGDGATVPDDAVAVKIPEGPFSWRPTPPRRTFPPYEPHAGEWRPWVLDRADRFRPPPPPIPGSVEFESAMEEVRTVAASLSEEQANGSLHWATSPPSMRWHLRVEEEVLDRRPSAVRAARIHALVSIAMVDAYIAGWEAKYHFWFLRPVTHDPDFVSFVPTPPHPAYPSGHSVVSAAAAEVLGRLFPERRAAHLDAAEEASLSRLWGGVHYRFDLEAGMELGRHVGALVVDQVGALPDGR